MVHVLAQTERSGQNISTRIRIPARKDCTVTNSSKEMQDNRCSGCLHALGRARRRNNGASGLSLSSSIVQRVEVVEEHANQKRPQHASVPQSWVEREVGSGDVQTRTRLRAKIDSASSTCHMRAPDAGRRAHSMAIDPASAFLDYYDVRANGSVVRLEKGADGGARRATDCGLKVVQL